MVRTKDLKEKKDLLKIAIEEESDLSIFEQKLLKLLEEIKNK